MSIKYHMATDETLRRIATSLAILAGNAALERDPETGEYTNEGIATYFARHRDGLAYGVALSTANAIAGTKLGANAGIANPIPGIVGRAAIDPYTALGPYKYLFANGWIDDDGGYHITAIRGDGRFKFKGNGNVLVLAPVLYYNCIIGEFFLSDTRLVGMEPQPGAVLHDGTLRPFIVYAKYVGSNDGNGMMQSVSGAKPWTYNVSHNSLITQCKTATTGYAGKGVADDWYVKAMFLTKYATKHSQSVFSGCTSYDLKAQVAVAESGTTRVVIPTTTANNLVVGSAVMVGTADADRSNATAHDVVDSARILRIEQYDASNSAVYLDLAASITTETTHYLKTAPWWTGACDMVEGDGSPTNPTSGKEPFVLQGIELGLGIYEVLGNVILHNDGTNGWEICICYDSRNESTGVTANYTHTGKYLPTDDADSWKYPLYPDDAGGLLFGAGTGGSQTTGMCDGTYTNKRATAGDREWLGLGNLNSGGNAGLWCVGGSNGLGNAWWNIGSRLSGTGRSRAAA